MASAPAQATTAMQAMLDNSSSGGALPDSSDSSRMESPDKVIQRPIDKRHVPAERDRTPTTISMTDETVEKPGPRDAFRR